MRPAVWIAALAAGVSIAGVAQAADYVVVGVEGNVGFVDLAGITRSGDMARGTVTRIWPGDTSVSDGVTFRYLVTDEEFNCRTRISHNYSLKAYSRRHVLVYQSSEKSDALEAVEPETLGHDVMRILCEGGAPVGDRQSASDRATLVDRLIGD